MSPTVSPDLRARARSCAGALWAGVLSAAARKAVAPRVCWKNVRRGGLDIVHSLAMAARTRLCTLADSKAADVDFVVVEDSETKHAGDLDVFDLRVEVVAVVVGFGERERQHASLL